MILALALLRANICKYIPKEKKTPIGKKNNNEFGEYYNYMCSGTNHRKARVVRGDIFKKHTLE